MKYEINRYTGNYNLSNRYESVKYIAVHYTAAQTPDYPHALNNCQYFSGGNRQASADFFIDNASIYQYNPDLDAYYTWHVGDGKGRYGITNSNSVGIEVCQIGDQPFTPEEIDRLHDLVLYLMNRFGVPRERVVRHYDASRKICPMYYAQRQDAWNELWNIITSPFPEEKLPEPEEPPVIIKYPDMEPDMSVESSTMYRLRNPNTNDHLFTSSTAEKNTLVQQGWEDEGIGFTMPFVKPIYRLYNTYSADHMMTTDLQETNNLIDNQWQYEGVCGFASSEVTDNPVYRLYNEYSGDHMFTMDENEYEGLKTAGWIDEGVAFYV